MPVSTTGQYVRVGVLHNLSSRFSAYEPGDLLSDRGQVTVYGASLDGILNDAYRVTNMGSGCEDSFYFAAACNRSMSVGDVFTVGEGFYAVDSCGFTAIAEPDNRHVLSKHMGNQWDDSATR